MLHGISATRRNATLHRRTDKSLGVICVYVLKTSSDIVYILLDTLYLTESALPIVLFKQPRAQRQCNSDNMPPRPLTLLPSFRRPPPNLSLRSNHPRYVGQRAPKPRNTTHRHRGDSGDSGNSGGTGGVLVDACLMVTIRVGPELLLFDQLGWGLTPVSKPRPVQTVVEDNLHGKGSEAK